MQQQPQTEKNLHVTPKDFGGMPGYYDFLDAISGPDNKTKTEALAWYDRPYDPDDIDEEQIKAALKRIATASRPKNQKLKPPTLRRPTDAYGSRAMNAAMPTRANVPAPAPFIVLVLINDQLGWHTPVSGSIIALGNLRFETASL